MILLQASTILCLLVIIFELRAIRRELVWLRRRIVVAEAFAPPVEQAAA